MSGSKANAAPARCNASRAIATWPGVKSPLFPGRMNVYIPRMKTSGGPNTVMAMKWLLGAAGLAAVTGAAFAAWMNQGAGIFMTMVESGLSWCF